MPVSVSISTTAMWLPKGNTKFGGSQVTEPLRFGSMPSGRSWAVNAPNARAWIESSLSGLPATRKTPSLNSRSSSATSSWWAASVRALSTTWSAAMTIAVPPTASDRDP